MAGRAGDLEGAHRGWNLVGLGLRSVSILINQVYRFSTSKIMAPRPAGGFQGHLARIKDDISEFRSKIGEDEKDCAGWLAADKAELRPVEFHPRYMQCLIAYGSSRAADSGWQRLN